MSGNPVKIGDGYATVTGYKLPSPLAHGREGGSEVKPQVRIPVCLCSSWFRSRNQLLRKEKDEASLPDCFRQGSSNAFIPRLAESEGFFMPL
jgi:hypothetical protein